METTKNEWMEWVKAIVVALLLAFLIRTFLFTSYEVQGESMEPSVFDGERFIVNKVGYGFSDPQRFDLVVFHASETEDYIKRVIGLPGDQISYTNDTLYINGEEIEEPFLEAMKKDGRDRYTRDFAMEEIVPEDHVFVLGDNRPNSLDSRRLGFIPMDHIVGKVDLRFWPITDVGIVK
ncbi:signal peptidase I [Halalkalibacter hemicellulosilyticus]|uniref:signal peptidase I n=1 Tax=Halalkalibacter hemicellulosilyticus TaxID=127886 RepID=UPI0005502193